MRRFAIGTVLLVAACATTSVVTPVHYQIVDSPEHGGFLLSYTNTTSRQMCLPPEFWPNGGGWFNHQGEHTVFIRVGTVRYPMKVHNTGYCTDDCSARVPSGETVTDFVPYDRFHLPKHLAQQPKQVEFSPPVLAHACSD